LTDPKDKDAFDLDWDDALSDWERDVDTSAEAKSNPMPQKPPVKPPAPPARALYQPPDPAEIARLRQQQKHPSFAHDDGSDESTIAAQIPSLPRPTAPPPGALGVPTGHRGDEPTRATQRPASPEMDLDDLLANLDEDTRHYPADVPKVAPTGVAAPKPPPPKPPAIPRPGGAAPVPPRPRSPLLKQGGVPRPPPPGTASRPEIERVRDSFGEDLASFEASLAPKASPPPPAPAATSSGETDALDALLFGEASPPREGPNGHSSTSAAAASSAPTPLPPAPKHAVAPPAAMSDTPSLDDLDMELDAALGAFAPPTSSSSGGMPAVQRNAPSSAPTPVPPRPDVSSAVTPVPPAPTLDAEAAVSIDDDGDDFSIDFADEGADASAPAAAAAEPSEPAEVLAPTPPGDLGDELFGASSAEPAPLAEPTSTASVPPPLPSRSAPPSPAAEAPAPSRADRGAQAARRTVRSRKPRREVFPLVGRQPHALAARAELLEVTAAAESVSASSRARALLAAAELRVQLGELDAVEPLVRRAHELDPNSLAATRMARAVAAAKRDVPAVAGWLERQAALVPESEGGERSVLWAAAADAWARAGDAARASNAARAAHEASPTLLTSLVALGFASEEPSTAGAYGVLKSASAGRLVRGIVTNAAARAVERGGAAPEGTSSEPAIALRALPALATPAERAAALEALAGSLDDELAEAARLLEISERVAAGEASDEIRDAVRRLGREGHRPAMLACALEAAIRDASADEAALSERLAGLVEGSERAALLGRASLLASARGEMSDAEGLARAAASSDASLGVVAAARTRLADLDPAKRALRVQTEGALVVAAKLARETGSTAQEAELLEQAADAQATVTADVLRLDALAAIAEDRRGEETLRVALRRSAREGSSTASRAPGALVAATLVGDLEAAQEAHAAAPTSATARLRVLVAESAVDAAQAWQDEAALSSGEQAARASRESARALVGFDSDRAGARLAASQPEDLAAAALFAMLAVREGAEHQGAPALRAQALSRYAAIDRDPQARARDLVRAALAALSGGDGEQTRALLARAAVDAPEDPILDLMRWRDATGNGAEIPADVIERRRPSGSDAGARALATHTALVLGGRGLDTSDLSETPASVTEAARAEAARRAARLDESRRPVVPPATVEEAGNDLAALRAMERAAAATFASGEAGLDAIAFAIAEHVSDPLDRGPYLREAYTVSLRTPPSDASETRVLALVPPATASDPWLARRAAGLAWRRDEHTLARSAGLVVAESLTAPAERASAATHALAPDLIDDTEAARAAVEVLRAFQVGAPEHPLVAEQLALVAARAGDHEHAAQALEQAARVAASPQRKARLFVAAADAHEEMGADPLRVVGALEEASKADVTYGQVFERLRTALERSGDKERLSGLVARRLAAGGEGPQAAALYLAQASLRESQNDIEGARTALRAALEHTTVEGSPEQLGALKKLAQLSLADEDYRGAAEALIRLAKLRREVEELRWIFFELAGIYDRHIPDVKRAEAAYRRVLKLVPDDAPAMERLAELYRRENMLPQAIEMLEALLKAEMDPDRSRLHRLTLAKIHEQSGDARRAEQTLETTRRASPTDLETLRALAEFYGRQKAQTALAMHLNRAAQDFRHALAADLSDEAAWIGLVEVLGWRGRHDAARAAATAAVSLGIVDVEVAKLVDEHGGAPACNDIVRLPEVADAVAPAALTSGVREALGRLGPYLDKVFAFDPRSHRAEKVGPRDAAVAKVLEDVGQWLGTADLEVWVAPSSPRLLVPFAAQPPSILVGREILQAPDAERQFLTARAAFVARAGLSGVLRAPGHELAATLAYVAQQFEPSYQPIGLDPGLVQEQGRRLSKVAPRKVIEEVGPLVLEMIGAPEYDAAKLPMAVSELGDRIALLATGSMPSALSAILKLAGLPTDAMDVGSRVGVVRRSPEASSLLSFAISEPCFEARRRSSAAR
jgi:tetratricopeptide (TPR) repeat protein